MGEILKSSFSFMMKKPWKLWGISLMCGLLQILANVFFGIIPGLAFGMCIILSASMKIIFLNGLQGEEPVLKNLFIGFKDSKTAIRTACGIAYSYLWILIWGLIPIVGFIFAIIKSYQYRFVPFIVVKQPEISAADAIKTSTEQTKGNKGKMFLADLLIGIVAFICNFIICSLLSVFITKAFANFGSGNNLIGLLLIVLGIVFLFIEIIFTILVGLYSQTVVASFYKKFGQKQECQNDSSETSNNPII